VNGSLEGDVAAINEQRTSANILNVETAAQIMSLPNANVGDALGRLPGVTLQRNEGQAQYVQIRGTEPRLSNTTIDGVEVPGEDPQVRQVDMEVIPGDLVGAVEINKTLSADQPADAIGGSVNLAVKQATGDRPTLTIQSTGGYTPIDTGQPEFLDTITAGDRFGMDKRWGALLNYSYDLNDLGTDDLEPTPDLDSNGNPTFDDAHVQEYFYNQTRWGFAGGLDYKLNEGSDIYMHGLFSNYKDYGQKFTYDIGAGSNGPGSGGNGKYSTSIRRPDYQIALITLGGNHLLTHSYIKYEIAAARSRFGAAAGNPGADFIPVPGSNLDNLNTCAYDPSATVNKFLPQYTGCTTPGSSVYDPTQYQLNDINLTSGQSVQLNLQAGAAMGIIYHLGTHTSTFEFGALVRNEHKGQAAFSPTYDCSGATPCTANGTPLMTQFTTSFTNPNFYGGSYEMGPITSFDLITGWLNAHPGAMPLDEGATHLNSDPGNYNLQERVTAGYIMNTLDFSSRLHLQTGLRIEATDTSNTGYIVQNDANGNYISTTPVSGGDSYINPMPSVQLRYNIDNNSDVRAVYGRGVSRPDPYQIVPYETLDESANPNAVNIGNPALVAEHANDYDLLYEKYLPSVGMLEGGYFYKQITLPIYTQERRIPNPFPNGTTTLADLTQEVNGDHAWVQGIEMAYQQHLTFLPGVLQGARIDANFTYTDSKNYNLTGRTDSPQLVGQAPYSWNINPAYATKRALVTMGISHNSANIYAYQYQGTGLYAVGGGIQGPLGDNYFFSHTQIDAQVSYNLGRGITVIVSGQNMNNEVFGFYNGSPQYMTQREFYRPMYSGGIRWTPRHE
jgi:TonB-dependent receptor